MLRAIGSKKNLEEQKYFKYIEDIINSDDIQELNKYTHHVMTTRLQHSINVSYYNYLVCKLFHLDERSAARAGLLHDLFFYNRKDYLRTSGEEFHSARHPRIALRNACENFVINDCERDIILKHMWPATLALPKYKETFVIILVDKYCAILEFIIPYLKKHSYKKVKKI